MDGGGDYEGCEVKTFKLCQNFTICKMELSVYTFFRFQMMPTTPKLFADLAFASGCITFPCAQSEKYVQCHYFSVHGRYIAYNFA